MKKIYRFIENNSCFFSISHSPKKSNSSCSFKDKIGGLHKRVSSSLAILLQSSKITHKKITSFHLYKHKAVISKQKNKK